VYLVWYIGVALLTIFVLVSMDLDMDDADSVAVGVFWPVALLIMSVVVPVMLVYKAGKAFRERGRY
jgi:uncharacterized membrane protein (DUF485 family)